MGVAITLADIAKRGLLGGGSGSSGGGSGGGAEGGTTGVSPKEVNFYDYDGTCVHAYTVAEAQALSELPAGPEHPGLVFQGWNWSLEGVKGLTRAMNIGAMYTTDDGTTRLYITLQEGRTSPMLGVGVNGTVTVDWGDGTEPDALTGTSVSTTVWTPNHAYAKPGDYVIRLTVDGEMAFTGLNSSYAYSNILRYSKTTDKRNYAYWKALRRLEIGDNISKIFDDAFQQCSLVSTVSIPKGVTTVGKRAFSNCGMLRAVSVPENIAKLESAFYQCKALRVAAIPSNVTVLDVAFSSCSMSTLTIPDGVTSAASVLIYNNALKSITIPGSMAVLGANMFNGCENLIKVTIMDGPTEINSAFYNCYSITHLEIPGSITNIASNAFYGCYSMVCYDFTACTAVPTLSATSAFTGIPADCEIRVPAALYDEWIAATNWATYADYIKAY